MSALAEVLQARGATVTGSDVDEPFFTTPVLERIGVPVLPFDARNVRGRRLGGVLGGLRPGSPPGVAGRAGKPA